MENRIYFEQDIKDCPKLPSDKELVYFKIVSVGPQTLQENEFNGEKIHNIVCSQAGYFILGEKIGDAMHGLVDRFLEKKESNEK